MRGHASRYEVPQAIADVWQWNQNIIRLGIACVLILVGGLLAYLLLRRKPGEGETSLTELPPLPELLPAPKAFPNPTDGQLTVRIELAGESPSAFLVVSDSNGLPMRQYEISGHQPWLDIQLQELPDAIYYLRITDGQAISAPTLITLLRPS
jgi:hypothetical protein